MASKVFRQWSIVFLGPNALKNSCACSVFRMAPSTTVSGSGVPRPGAIGRGLNMNVPSIRTNVVPPLASTSTAGVPSNCPFQRAMLASTEPPAAMIVSVPSRASPSTRGNFACASRIDERGASRVQPSGITTVAPGNWTVGLSFRSATGFDGVGLGVGVAAAGVGVVAAGVGVVAAGFGVAAAGFGVVAAGVGSGGGASFLPLPFAHPIATTRTRDVATTSKFRMALMGRIVAPPALIGYFLRVSYDLVDVKAPRASGNLLRMLATLLENPVTGAALANKIVTDAGIVYLRDTPCDDPHPTTPPLPMLPAPDAFQAEPTAALSLDLPAGAAPGFAFESVADFEAAYREGRASPVDVAERVLAWTGATEELTPKMRIFISQRRDDVLRQAEAAAKRWQDGAPLSPLDGVPVAVKDELDQTPYPTTVGTRFLGQVPASADATVVARIRAAGAVLIGKTNMHEMGLGVTGLNPHHGACRNPYDPAHATGGSSSGPAAAVAAGLCPVAIGADGGGSIRIPSGFCGVVGLKATFGRVSEHGAAPLCWSVAHVGPIAATVRDTALAYALMAGPDEHDPNSRRQPPVHLAGYDDGDLSGVTIGLYRPWFEDADTAVVHHARRGVALLEAAGAKVVEIEIPNLRLLQSTHLVTIASEMAAAHARYFPGHKKDYGLDTRMNLALARRLTAADYVHAQRHRKRLCDHFLTALKQCDVIATPTTGCTAPEVPTDALVTGESNLPLTTKIMRFAQPGNLTGLPGISVPAGYDESGLPVGLQLMGRPWAEHTLLRLARVVEAGTERRAPKVHRRLLGAA